MNTHLIFRKRLTAAALLIAVLAAGYIALPTDAAVRGALAPQPDQPPPLMALVDNLNRVELAHILGHLLIFGGAAFLLGPWGGGSVRLACTYTLIAALAMEALQAAVGYSDDTRTALITGILFDLGVDGVAVLLGLLAARGLDRVLGSGRLTPASLRAAARGR